MALNYGWKSLSWHKIGDQTSFSDIEVVVWRKRTQETEYHFCLNKIQVICRKLLSITCFVCMIIYIRDIFWHPFIDLSIFGQNWSVSNLYIGDQKNYSCVHPLVYGLSVISSIFCFQNFWKQFWVALRKLYQILLWNLL